MLALAKSATTARCRRAVPGRKPRPSPQLGPSPHRGQGAGRAGVGRWRFACRGSTAWSRVPPTTMTLALTVLAAVLDGYSGARLDRALTQGRTAWPIRLAPERPVGRGPQLVHARRRAGARARQPPGGGGAACQVARVGRAGVTEAELARQDPVGGQRGLQARLGDEPGAGTGPPLKALGLPLDAGRAAVARLRQSRRRRCRRWRASIFGDDQLTVATLLPQPRAEQRGAAPGAAPASALTP